MTKKLYVLNLEASNPSLGFVDAGTPKPFIEFDDGTDPPSARMYLPGTQIGVGISLTISGGTLTIPGPGVYIVASETGVLDDLDAIISPCRTGDRIFLRAAAGSIITLRNAYNNILTLPNMTSLVLGESQEDMWACELVLQGITWYAVGCGSTNGILAQHRNFTETDGAGIYTATVILPADATVLDVRWSNQALWGAATSAILNIGDGDDADGYFAAIDLKTTPIADVNHAGGISSFLGGLGIGGYTPTNVTPDRSFNADSTSLDEIADVLGTALTDLGAVAAGAYAGKTKYSANGQTITATVVTVGATGATGRSRLSVIYAVGEGIGAAKT